MEQLPISTDDLVPLRSVARDVTGLRVLFVNVFAVGNSGGWTLVEATQRPELHGPPSYFTTDWDAARESVNRLAALDAGCMAPGHGQPVSGPEVALQLRALASRFDELARPAHGRYVDHPVRG